MSPECAPLDDDAADAVASIVASLSRALEDAAREARVEGSASLAACKLVAAAATHAIAAGCPSAIVLEPAAPRLVSLIDAAAAGGTAQAHDADEH